LHHIRSELPQIELRDVLNLRGFDFSFPFMVTDEQKFSDLKTILDLTKLMVSLFTGITRVIDALKKLVILAGLELVTYQPTILSKTNTHVYTQLDGSAG